MLFASASHRREFLGLIESAGTNVEATTDLLDQLVRSWPERPALRDQVKLLEEEGDRITREILHGICAPNFSALDREDIHALAQAVDDVVDFSEEVADMLGLYKVEAPMEQAVELTGVLRDAGREIAQALAKLEAIEDVVPHLRKIDALEDQGDTLSRRALAVLFSGGIDPMVVIRWKDLFERLEDAIDACEAVAHVLEGIVLKKS